ncbi:MULTISPECIES: hypothetical protein [Herbaspirillum]|uniref:hypothetical protein n=1 Tax=Herbaspirillum TaxID=963 RepID=UPI000C0A718C|nr:MULTISPECIES: hypothetical protein [Herbaspirillum]MAF04708.1 hypothetical protein [Herbaspirillum sp.]UWE19400.1 hypothetical protein NY669_26860 [Herbaspirillum huttiense]|tara:strand:+ start:25012 stop:25377 length:366 start_codon:yes stop_codon:yes gene_type:complete
MQFNAPPQTIIQHSEEKKTGSLKTRMIVIALLTLAIIGCGAALWYAAKSNGAKNLAQVNLHMASQDVTRLTDEVKSIKEKLATAEAKVKELTETAVAKESQLQAFALQAKACEVLRAQIDK